MNYNLLIDSEFKKIDKYWELINCSYSNGNLISNNKTFGIKQRLTLKGINKVYFRFLYKALGDLKRVAIGIQKDSTLYINEAFPRNNIDSFISIVETLKGDSITLHLIFESDKEDNKVEIRRPLLVDIEPFKYEVKYKLDQLLDYRRGHSYYNQFKSDNFKKEDWEIEGNCDVEAVEEGIIIKSLGEITLKPKQQLIDSHLYLIKCSYKSINDLGSISIKSNLTSGTTTKEQIFMIFKASEKDKVRIEIDSKAKIESIISLENILLVDISEQSLKLKEDDLERLPYC